MNKKMNKKIDEILDYVIVRARFAGVHAGEYVSHNGSEVVLKNARRLWLWRCNNGYICLSGVATGGLADDYTRLGPPIAVAHVLDACEILECTPEAAANIAGFPTWTR